MKIPTLLAALLTIWISVAEGKDNSSSIYMHSDFYYESFIDIAF